MSRSTGLKKHVELACNLWDRFMAGKIDCSIFDDDRALDYAVSMRILLRKHDSTGLIERLFTGELDRGEWRAVGRWRRHNAFEDMCRLRVSLHRGGYFVYCSSKRRRKCDECPVV